MRKKRAQPELVYKTQDEIAFLKKICRGLSTGSKVNLLKRYRTTLTLRKRWDRLDPQIIDAYLNLEIGGKE